MREFWRWKTFRSYVMFYLWSVGLFTVVYFGFNNTYVVEFTGIICQLCDGLVALPQAWSNCEKRSVKNLSYWMVFLWLFGDIARLVYYFIAEQPTQFIVGGATAIIMDLIVVGQIFEFGKKKALESI